MDIDSIFTRHLPAVKELHDSIKSDLSTLERHVADVSSSSGAGLSLLDVIFAGQKLKTFEDPKAFKEYRDEIELSLSVDFPDLPQVNKYKVFSKTEITGLAAGYKFVVQNKKWQECLTDSSPTKRDLERLSYRMKSPSTLLALKYFWLYLEYGEPGDVFDGVLASTAPVRTALIRLYGTDFKSQLAASMQQQRMAVELGIDAFTLNSVLWIMGQE